MGVRGLTTYINKKSNKFFEEFKLRNSSIIIDGNCLATILFYNLITNTASFGGDYDKYAKGIEQFFNELLKCSITPIVIFDGGYEKKKLHTVYMRNKNKMLSLCNIGPTNHSKVCFPLMMRQVFRDVLREMNIPFAQSDFEADQEIAALARKLQCPVLSNDSDFFIYDVTLIPINEFPLEASTDRGGGQPYMKCVVYKVENFLLSLGGLPKSHLPLLAALLGNDYISSSTFANFYSQMKITRGRKQGQIHCRVEAIISWLKKETFESALRKILCHLKKNKQKQVAAKVAKIIQGYSQVSTSLDAYLVKEKDLHSDIEILNVEDILKQYDNIDDTLEIVEEQPETCASDSEGDSFSNNEVEELNEDEISLNNSVCTGNNIQVSPLNNPTSDPLDFKELSCNVKNIPTWLIDYSRQGNLPSCIITLFSLKIYFCVPQVEDYEMCHAGNIGLPILSKIAGILLGDDFYSYYCRTHKCKYVCNKIPTITNCDSNKLPLISSLNQLNISQKKCLFTDIFEISADLLEIVNYFPEEWHLFIFSVIFWSKNIKEIRFQSYFLHAVTSMIICIRVIGNKIGYFRNKRPFMQRYASKMKKFDSGKRSFNECKQIDDIIELIPLEECLLAFEIFLPYFQINEKLKTNAKFFSRSLIHAFAQFQVCIDMAYTLNCLLSTPFDCIPIHNFLNSTFLYNFCANYKKRTNITAYVETLLVQCPTILYLHRRIMEHFSGIVTVAEKPDVMKKKRRRKKVGKKSEIESSSEKALIDFNNEKDLSSYSDEDNAYALLSKLDLK